MQEELATPWWSPALKALGLVAGLALFLALLLGSIKLAARYLDSGRLPDISLPSLPSNSAPPRVEQNAKTRVPSPYEPLPWPNFGGSRSGRSQAAGGGDGSAALSGTQRPGVPVGISPDQFRATVASGGKVYLPDPQGECDIRGMSAATLESCFARQAAR